MLWRIERQTEISDFQFRCNGSDGYLAWLDHVLQIRTTANTDLTDIDCDFRVFDYPSALRRIILEKNRKTNKARMVAGYCWPWLSRKDNQTTHLYINNTHLL